MGKAWCTKSQKHQALKGLDKETLVRSNPQWLKRLVARHRRFAKYTTRTMRLPFFRLGIYVLDVLDAFALQPLLKRLCALLGVNRNTSSFQWRARSST